MADQLQNESPVLPAGRMVPCRLKGAEDLRGVGQIEVPRQHQRPVQTRIFTHKGVTGVDSGAAEGSVPQMAEIEFAAEGKVVFRLFAGERFLRERRNFPADLFEQIGEAGAGVGFFQLIAGEARKRIQTDAAEPRAAVVLFLQQQRHLLESVIRRAVFADIVIEAAAEPQQCDGAFMFDLIRHNPNFLSASFPPVPAEPEIPPAEFSAGGCFQ